MAGIIILVIAFISFLIWFLVFHPYVSTDDARVDADIIRVVNQGAAQRVEKISVEEGTRVRRDDLLVELDHKTAQAQFDKAKARAYLSSSDLKRAETLIAQNGMSRQQYDRVAADARTADADLRLAEIALDNTYIKSPVNGVVIQKVARQGNILETNQTAVTVVDIDKAWISANIEETKIARVYPGQPVKITVDEGGSLTGKVMETRRAAASQFALIPSDNASGNFIKLVQRIPVKISIDPHPGRDLRVGQSVEIKIRVR